MNKDQRRSKLEIYVDILKILAQKGPLRLTRIMYKANVNCTVLKDFLDSLCQQNLAEEQVIQKRKSKKTIYGITERGRMALNCFKEISVFFQTTEELPTPYIYR